MRRTLDRLTPARCAISFCGASALARPSFDPRRTPVRRQPAPHGLAPSRQRDRVAVRDPRSATPSHSSHRRARAPPATHGDPFPARRHGTARLLNSLPRSRCERSWAAKALPRSAYFLQLCQISWKVCMLDEFLAELRKYPSLWNPTATECALLAGNLPRRHAFAPRTEHLAGLCWQPQLMGPGMRRRLRCRGMLSLLDTLRVKPGHRLCR